MAPSTPNLSPQAFALTQLHLLSVEQESEVSETELLLSSTAPGTLARAGLAVLNLTVSSLRTGLGGRTVAELGLDPAVSSGNAELPEHGLRSGDIVRVGEQPKGGAKRRDVEALKGRCVEGVVTRVGDRAVWVAIGKEGGMNEDVEVPDGKLWAVKLANDVTYRRISQALTRLSKMTESDYTPLQRVLLGLSSPGPVNSSTPERNMSFINPTINDSQRAAVRHAVSSPELSLIHGPPGTGKTSTIIELIVQFLLRNPQNRILVCGPSNISVDNIVERLSALPSSIPEVSGYSKPSFVRLGHPARLLPSVLQHSLEVLTRTGDTAQITQSIRAEMDAKQSSIRKTRSRQERHKIYTDLKDLRKELRVREAKSIGELVRTSNVVCATLHGAGGKQLFGEKFDVVIIDEASQALEALCWIPMLTVGGGTVGKLVLAGDHLQLPPTVKSTGEKIGAEQKKHQEQSLKGLEEELSKLSISEKEVKAVRKASLETTMFDRLLGMYGEGIKTLLNVQYRMNTEIMRFPSQELYEGKLVAHESCEMRLLKDLEYGVEETDDTKAPVVFWDTQGGDFPERQEEDEDKDAGTKRRNLMLSDSKSNPNEAALVVKHVSELIAAGVRPDDVAVITPYNAQLGVLSKMLKESYPGIELGSVDGFQGREKEAVVLSLVRSNTEGEVGFLGEKRRLNVAMTRPKRHLCVVGDSDTVSRGSPFLKRWMQFLEENADLRYPSQDDLAPG